MPKIVPIRRVASETGTFPELFRLESFRCEPLSGGRVRCDAVIYHHPFRYETYWEGHHDETLSPGQLVRIEWGGWPLDPDGKLTVAKLVRAVFPERECNLFVTAPDEWIGDLATRRRAADLWNELSSNFQTLFNAIFWDSARFHTYLTRQSTQSMRHHYRHGALARALELTELALHLARIRKDVDRSILIFAGLLVEANDDRYLGGRCASATDQAAHTAKGWIDEALARRAFNISERALGILRDALSVTAKPSPCIVFSEPCPPEAKIILALESLTGAFDFP